MTIQPSDAFQQVRVPQPSHAQPRGSSWRNRFAASPVSHGLRHLASAGKLPPLRLISSRSRGKAGSRLLSHRALHSKHAQATSPPCRRAPLAGRTIGFVDSPGTPAALAKTVPALDELWGIMSNPAQDRRMSNMHPAFGHHLDQITKAELVA